MAVKTSNPFDLDSEEVNSMDKIMESIETEDKTNGTIVLATILDMDDREVFMDIGSKQDGRCSISEFEEKPVRGTQMPVVVIHSPEGGLIQVSRKEAVRISAWDNIKEIYAAKAQLSGVVEKAVNHGYIVVTGGVNLFLPQSQADLKGKTRVRFSPGTKIDFKILEIKDRHMSAIISRRAVLEERNDERWNELLEKYHVGDEIEGVVSKKVSFGLFVDVGGIEGLLHQSDISWKKFSPFKNRFHPKEKIKLKILTMDRENNRLSLGLKQLTEDPWEWAKRELKIGENIKGKVLNLTDYGAFVEIQEGLEGLIHVSELSWSKKTKHPKKYLTTGQEIEARILVVDLENKRIALGLKQLQGDPWDEVKSKIRAGDIIEGEVTSIAKFGAFVKIREDIEGLIHFSDYSWDDNPDKKLLKPKDNVRFKILEVNNQERRISCGLKQLTPSPYEEFRRKHRKGDVMQCKVVRIAPFGLFVDMGGGFEGLIHEKELPSRGDKKLEEVYNPGDSIQAVLVKIDADAKKISLSVNAFEKKSEKDLINQYIKRDDSPSTSSLGAFFKKES